MSGVVIAEHALKHGISEERIRYAWDNFVVRQYRGAPNEGEVVAIGYDRNGELMQMVAVERMGKTIVFHAMGPPSRKVLRELGLVRR